MKVIISRKGFDTQHGGRPSPILPCGDMYSLPIPYDFGPTTFGDVVWEHGGSVADLVEDLTDRRVTRGDICHLDPDLRAVSLERQEGWRPAFGQVSREQNHLNQNDVATHDIFLFFGSFRRIERTARRWRYLHGAPRVHAIFGWLQIGERVTSPTRGGFLEQFPWLSDHPHTHNIQDWPGQNAIYISGERLVDPRYGEREIPGAGTFSYDEQLVLTAEHERRPKGRMSHWRLFPWCGRLQNRRFSRINAAEDIIDEGTISTHKGYWQELVVDERDYPGVGEWAIQLIRGFGRF